MLNFSQSTTTDYVSFARALPADLEDYETHEEASQRIVESLYQSFVDERPYLSLVRIYRLCAYDELAPELQSMTTEDTPYVMALTGTYGEEEAWCNRHYSQGHKLIPVKPSTVRSQIPMFEKMLVDSMGVDLDVLYETGDPVAATKGGLSGLFHVPVAEHSPVIPAQEGFVIPYGIESVVGFGGIMAGTASRYTMYVLYAFSKQPINYEAAARFQEIQPFIGAALANTTKRYQVFSTSSTPEIQGD